MPKYRVSAERTTHYEVTAETQEQAIDLMIDGAGDEVDGETTHIAAAPLCPTCDEPLTNRTQTELGENTYCDVCDREMHTPKQKTYTVRLLTTTTYEVSADDPTAARTAALRGDAKEIGSAATTSISTADGGEAK